MPILFRIICAGTAFLMIVFGAVVPASSAAATPSAPSAASLAESGPSQPTWLSVPNSRLVLNPYDVLSERTPLEQTTSEDLPLNAGYYVDDQAKNLPELLMVGERPATAAPGTSEPLTSFKDSFTSLSSSWVPTAMTTASVSNGLLSLKTPNTSGTHYGYITRTITVDLDKFPVVRISVPSVAEKWGLKVNDNPAGSDIILQDSVSTPGTFEYDVAAKTGWSGTKTFYLRIFAVGYNKPITVDDVQFQTPSTPSLGFSDSFTGSTDPGWSISGAGSLASTGGNLVVKVPGSTGTHYAFASRSMTLDLNKYHNLQFGIQGLTGNWGLKVNDGGGDVIIYNTNASTGQFQADLREATGWSGTKSFSIRIFAVDYGSTVAVDRLQVSADVNGWIEHASSRSSTWMPHKLQTTAAFPSGLTVGTSDVFNSVDSVTRLLSIGGVESSTQVQISGAYRGTASFAASTRTLTVDSAGFEYSTSFPALSEEIRYYPNRDALEMGGPSSLAPYPVGGYWSVLLDLGSGSTTSTSIGLGFRADSDAGAGSASLAQAAAAVGARTSAPAARETEWNQYLAGVPRPENFDISAIASEGVTSANVKSMYYRAWVFLSSNILPPQPEVGFAHSQLATGKPAMYTHGAPGAAASASWDVDMGLQYLVYVDPDTAWDALEGLMSLVPANGALPGEYLPSREVQTAWILYRVTGDTSRLGALYPTLKNLLVYKQDHPKYGGDTVAGNKDIAFVSSALADTRYAQKIAGVLGETADISYWDSRYNALHANMLTWFWATPTAAPVQKYDVSTGTRSAGRVITTTSALILPTITGSYANGLINRFDELYDSQLPLAGFGNGTNDVRHPIMSYTQYGLLQNGEFTKVNVLTNALLRDSVRSGMLSERYQWDGGGPFAAGQRPSLFGVAQVIDSVWMKNGYRMDMGDPAFLLLPGADGGVFGLAIQGHTLNVEVDDVLKTASVSGTLISTTAGCGSIALVTGATVSLSPTCSEAN